MSLHNRRYYEEYGVDVNVEFGTEFGHYFKKSAADDSNGYLLKKLTRVDVKPSDPKWREKGLVGKFDQDFFAKGVNPDIGAKELGLREWGYYYIPYECSEIGAPECYLNLVLHGCTQPAEEFLDQWGSFAANNRMVMIFPQAANCWANFDPTNKGDLTHLTPEAPQMKFMEALVDTARRPLLGRKEFNYK